ncbi:hypothetical protein FF125_13695 [Aureibaculum algae]|uniref:Histidyl-tRNA synthetase n=1 Tax=Aureibaculum algae TaxID=2584122 RepID=A0A5B7TR57_9FLAO|nr:DUF6495 family protein [Aureibaculum algae]QCX39439.1 hypothetical protein FF125_13695 [Aureibaculum algae]
MKYRQLTKEQFEALHVEFAQFLASQQVDINEWNAIKKDKPEVAEQELNLFSDVVWDDVLNRTKYLEHFSEKSINLFKVEEKDISRIVVQINKTDFSFFNDKDYQWFIDNTKDGSITFYKGVKKYESDRNSEIFDLIQKGSVIADGKLYEGLFKLIS